MTAQPHPSSTVAGGAADEVNQLIERLTRQRDLYQQLKALSDQQGQLIADGQAEPLLAVLSQRQTLVDELTRLNAEVAPLRQRWTELARHIREDQRPRVNALLEEVETLLAAIIEQDDAHRQQLQGAKQRIAEQLERTNTAGRAMHAYRPAAAAGAPARFTDRSG